MNKRNVLIFSILLILYLIFKLGLYQNKTIIINDIKFNKPNFYRMNLLTSSNNISILKLTKDYFALNNKFQIDKASDKTQLIILEQFLLGNKIVLIFDYHYNLEIFPKVSKNTVDYKNCYYISDKDESKNVYIFQGITKNTGISFNIFSKDKQDLLKIRNDICH